MIQLAMSTMFHIYAAYRWAQISSQAIEGHNIETRVAIASQRTSVSRRELFPASAVHCLL